MKNNKTRFFFVLYFDKTWVFDQSERAPGPSIIILNNGFIWSFTGVICRDFHQREKPYHYT